MAKKSTRLEALHNTFKENGISPDTIELIIPGLRPTPVAVQRSLTALQLI